VNAFTVLMNSAHQLARCTLPSQIDNPKTGKQRLWNAVLDFLSKYRVLDMAVKLKAVESLW